MLAATMTAGSLCLGMDLPAQAGNREKTYRIGTYLGSAATIYALAKGEDTWALIGGAATLLSYTQSRKDDEGTPPMGPQSPGLPRLPYRLAAAPPGPSYRAGTVA